jgi:ribose transport system ATP-binding protein
MHEIQELADTISVFRNGRHVGTFGSGEASGGEIVQMMIGREMSAVYPPKPLRNEPPAPVLEVDGLSWTDSLSDISFTVGKGEIVGLGGLDGQGQRQLLLALFGVLRGVGRDRQRRWPATRPGQPDGRYPAERRDGAHPGRPQDGGADAANVDRR